MIFYISTKRLTELIKMPLWKRQYSQGRANIILTSIFLMLITHLSHRFDLIEMQLTPDFWLNGFGNVFCVKLQFTGDCLIHWHSSYPVNVNWHSGVLLTTLNCSNFWLPLIKKGHSLSPVRWPYRLQRQPKIKTKGYISLR